MSNKVRRLSIIDMWHIGENESYFSDMARDGLHLERVGAFFARFRRGEPADVRYRIDVHFDGFDLNETSNEQKMLYRENGWEFVCRGGNVNIYRSDASANAPELHTDPAEQAYTLKGLRGRIMFSAFIVIFSFLFSFFVQFYTFTTDKTPVLSMIEGSKSSFFINSLLMLYLIVHHSRAIVSIHRLIRSLREGKPINHHADWRRHRRFALSLLIILALLTPLTLGMPLAQLISRSNEELPLEGDNQLILRLSDIEQDAGLTRRSSYINDFDWANSVRYKWSPLAPIQLDASERGEIKGRNYKNSEIPYSPSLDYKLYKLRFPAMSPGLIEDFKASTLRWYEIHDELPVFEELQLPQADSFILCVSEGFSEVFACRGEYVIFARYSGERGTDALIRAVAELLGGLY